MSDNQTGKRGSKIQAEAESLLGMPIYKWCEINCVGMSRHEASDAIGAELSRLGCERIPGTSSVWNFVKAAQSEGLTEYNFIGKKGRRKKSSAVSVKKPVTMEVSHETDESAPAVAKPPVASASPMPKVTDEEVEVTFTHRDDPSVSFTEMISAEDLVDGDSRIVACHSHGDGYNPVYVASFEIGGTKCRKAMVELPTSKITVESFVDEDLNPIRNPFTAAPAETSDVIVAEEIVLQPEE